MSQGREQPQEAIAASANAFLLEPYYVPSKILLSVLMLQVDSKTSALPVARSLLSDALRLEPTNRMAWYYLGKVHKCSGRIGDAADCFQAAFMLEESDPLENFSSVL